MITTEAADSGGIWLGPLGYWGFGDSTWWITLVGITNFAIVLIMLFTVGKNRRPTTAVAWLLTVTLIPYVGLLLFAMFGSNHLPRSQRRKQAEFDDLIRDTTQGFDDRVTTTMPNRFRQVARLARELTAIPHLPGNRIQIHTEYDATIRELAHEIDRAEQYVHVLFYTMGYDDVTEPFFDAIERARDRGVTVRVLFDQIGTVRYSGYRKLRSRLREIGVDYHHLYPVLPWKGGWQRFDLRNHRKLLVIDGRIGWVGSQNVIARDYHKRGKPGEKKLWQDVMLRVQGPMAIALDSVFRNDWYLITNDLLEDAVDPTQQDFIDDLARDRLHGDNEGAYDCQLVPSGPGYENENNLRIFVQLLYLARKRVVIATPYFAPDDSMLYAITTAAQRGVEVELYVSAKGDQFFIQHAQQSFYDQLLRAGVRIHRYNEPYILHAKHMTVDDEVSFVGSSNLDMRSFTLNAELMLLIYGRAFAARMHEVEESYRASSKELTLEEWRQRPWYREAADNVARLTSVVQ
ncbi:cardiolipin synthase [Gulosibacter faecalis]|jgi:cardiolipin synthase|uniref:Cardiolipin synthase n=1 Tax=Gulosibacter faecalis TaxID=272240 RepID=A0ABW5UWB9_9MICO|nr:cardiolipin synthase [Gulosibacter faecalis]